MDAVTVLVIASSVVLFAVVSRRLADTVLTAPMVFSAFGLLVGDAGFRWARVDYGSGFAHGLMEVTLILVLFSDAARIDLSLLRRDHDLPLRMLVVGMPLTVLAGALAGWALPLGLTFVEAALLAAILAPTDAALGQSVVTSPAIPARIRQTLNVESGLNDGIALPLVLFLAAASAADETGAASRWLLFGLAQITIGPLLGLAVGSAGAWLLDRSAARGWTAESFQGPAILSVALLSHAVAELLGGNGFIAAFVAGLVFGNRVRGHCRFLFEFAESEGQLLTLLTFLIFGATVLPRLGGQLDGAMLLYAAASLTALRMLPVAASLLGTGVRTPTVLFLGWFGPRGLASMLFALLVLEEVATPAADGILLVTITTVAMSIVVHGVTAAPGSRAYARLVLRMGECPESRSVSEMGTRFGR